VLLLEDEYVDLAHSTKNYLQFAVIYTSTLAKFRKLTINFVMSFCLSVCRSVRLSVRLDQLVFQRSDCHEIWYLNISRKTV